MSRAYGHLMEFNEHCRGALKLLSVFAQQQIAPHTECVYYGALLEEVRAAISHSATESLEQRESSAAAAAERRRLRLERKMRE